MGILDYFKRNKNETLKAQLRPEVHNYNEFIIRSFDAVDKISSAQIWKGSGGLNYNHEVLKNFNEVLKVSRHLAKNDDYFRAILREIAVNVVGGQGFRISPSFKNKNGDLMIRENADIKHHWNRFCRKKYCDVRKKRSFYDIVYTGFISSVRDGGSLIELINDDSEYGLSLSLYPIEMLDVNLNTELSNGNLIVMGIEINGHGAPLNYYLKTDGVFSGNDVVNVSGQRYRVISSENMIHHFRSSHTNAIREVSWLVSGAERLGKIKKMDMAILRATFLAASNFAFGIADNEASSGGGSYQGRGRKMPSESGIPIVPGVKDIKSLNPDVPKDTYAPFLETQQRAVCSGAGVSYNIVGNDLEGVAYAGLRHRQNADEDNWETLQKFVASDLIEPVYDRFLIRSALKGKFNSPLVNNRPWLFEDVDFIPKKFKPIDSLKAARALKIEIETFMKSRASASHERGYDYEDEEIMIRKEYENLKDMIASEDETGEFNEGKQWS